MTTHPLYPTTDELTQKLHRANMPGELQSFFETLARSGAVPGCRTSFDDLQSVTRDLTATGGSFGSEGGVNIEGKVANPLRSRHPEPVLVSRLGAIDLPIAGPAGDITFPEGTDISPTWEGELVAPAAASPTFSEAGKLSPNRLTAFSVVSWQLLRQASSFESWLVSAILTAIRSEIERASLLGTGADNQPMGIMLDPNVPEIDCAEAAPSATNILDALEGVENEPGNPDLQWLISVRAMRALRLHHMQNFAGLTAFPSELKLGGYPVTVSRLLPDVDNFGTMILGRWSDLTIARWAQIEMLANPYSLDIEGKSRISATVFADTVITRPASFIRLVNAGI